MASQLSGSSDTPTDNEGIDVVIAEDNRLQAKVLADRLTKAGYQVRVAVNGREALEEIRRQRPALLISDIEMPEMTGHELCREIKNDPQLADVPVILLSTLADPVDIIRGLDCGADNYVTKPYRMSYLQSRMESLLQTPLSSEQDDALELNVTLMGDRYTVKSGRQQVLNLLVSTFENAVEKNQELLRFNEELQTAKQQLSRRNTELESANERMQRDLTAAAKIQHSLLPTASPTSDRMQFAWKYLPCDELAGDFLNVFQLDDDHIALFVVDVSGHGVPSSLLSVTVGRVLVPHVTESALLVRQNPDGTRRIVPPREVAEELNRRFPMEDQGDLYFTMVYGVINTKTLQMTYTSAGHNAIVLARRDQLPKMLSAEGFAIGWIEDIQYDEHTVQLEPGDRVYLYSDGIPEALDENLKEFDEPRMLELMRRCQDQSVDQAVDTVCKAVAHWCRVHGPKDDVSLLAVEVKS
ncbi:MAG: SpoIIE family protein phosphatase [Planctomycetota bacterium]